MISKRETKSEDSTVQIVEKPLPPLITLGEFILSLSKQRGNYFESLGAFNYWIQKQGCPKKWPYSFWKEKFDEFLTRKA